MLFGRFVPVTKSNRAIGNRGWPAGRPILSQNVSASGLTSPDESRPSIRVEGPLYCRPESAWTGPDSGRPNQNDAVAVLEVVGDVLDLVETVTAVEGQHPLIGRPRRESHALEALVG